MAATLAGDRNAKSYSRLAKQQTLQIGRHSPIPDRLFGHVREAVWGERFMRLSAVLLTGTVLAYATPALAAEATGKTTAAAQPAIQVAAPTSQEVQPGDQAIIVTARKREERLQNVPVAVTAVSGDVIERRGIQQIK